MADPGERQHVGRARAGHSHQYTAGPPHTTLIDMVADTGMPSFEYIYDFGDQWCHTVRIVKPMAAAPGVDRPRRNATGHLTGRGQPLY